MMIEDWLPTLFIGLLGLSVLVYAILDGYDLGVGILLPMNEEPYRDTMIASIGPFWDANETWLVLAVGILLIAFPSAHSVILQQLYLPCSIMLIGLILRGVAFDFRAKAAVAYKRSWDYAFKTGSIITSLSQGYMLGLYVVGFETSFITVWFAMLSAVGVVLAYALIGSCWLILKAEGKLQLIAINWARRAAIGTWLGVILVSLVNLSLNPDVFGKWFQYPLVMFVLLIPVACMGLFGFLLFTLSRLPKENDRHAWLPFAITVCIFVLTFSGLAFSFYPYVVPGQVTIWQAASATESLSFIAVGAVIVVPVILMYTAFAYWVFRGKTTSLKYY